MARPFIALVANSQPWEVFAAAIPPGYRYDVDEDMTRLAFDLVAGWGFEAGESFRWGVVLAPSVATAKETSVTRWGPPLTVPAK